MHLCVHVHGCCGAVYDTVLTVGHDNFVCVCVCVSVSGKINTN